MKQNHTSIVIVLDRSGSMSSIAAETIGGFNRFLKDQQAVKGTADLTLAQFDDQFEYVHTAKNIAEVPPLDDKTFVPRGYTALLDAIGKSVTDHGARLAAMPEHERPEKVVCVIITDGAENASKEFTKARINEMITHQREKYQWEFVFLAANQDAIAVGANLGVLHANAMTYAANSAGADATYTSLSKNMSNLRTKAVASMAFDQSDLNAQVAAGINNQ